MEQDHPPTDQPGLVAETRAIWDAKAAYWDARMGDGNPFQLVLIGPAVERLLAVQPGQRVLDIACGNGVFARRLAHLGARVTAVDFSPRFLELARARSAAGDDPIDYRLADATDEARLVALGEAEYDAVICNQALMDMPVIDPLFRAARRLLRSHGRFVFALAHPAFNSNAASFGLEERDQGGDLVESRYVKMSGYLSVPPGKGAGMPGEPVPHWYFHRPLTELFGACFAAGFVIDGLDEPAFGPEHAIPERPLAWYNFDQFPPVLAVRARPVTGSWGGQG
ncbi:MAG: class I SAM-dependent methyltransferase [Chloroflexota bacterium]|nr:class I SAM-dependent methyltransferase [Chloroflexota bacterium]